MKREFYIFREICKDKNYQKKNVFVRGRPIVVVKYEDLEYVHSIEGRCLSYRSKGKISSIKFRNTKYGTEHIVLVANPRVVLRYL